MSETVPISTVIMIVTTLISAAVGIYAILLRMTVSTYEKANERRFVDLEKAADQLEKGQRESAAELTAQNHELEKACITLQGEVNLLKQNHDRSTNDIESIKDHMVTKAEWEPRMTSMERTLETILKEIRAPSRPYGGSTSSSRYSAMDPTKKPGT